MRQEGHSSRCHHRQCGQRGVLFAPVGWLLRVVLPQAGAVVAAGAGLLLLIGLGQLLLSRAADVKDVMLTSCGWPLGAGLTRLRTRAS
ncbi:VanZ family protein [Streptomyces sp. NPDC059582]|uniref:VanZ family protein n=1 Tax=Streptomyces sp. NPDC059582 TaxID=3346875 RepID=UPI0036AC004A